MSDATTTTEAPSAGDVSGPMRAAMSHVAEKCRELQSKLEEKEKELERLRQHLIDQEDAHTQQLLESDQKEQQLQSQLKAKEELEQCIPVLTTRCEEWQTYGKQKDQECQRLNVAVANLQAVLEQLQTDQEQIIEREVRPLRAELSSARNETQEALAKASKVTELERSVASHQQMLQVARRELAESRAETERLRMEVEPLRQAVDRMGAQIDGMARSEEDSVDKRVVKKMVLTFVARPSQRHDVLELMNRILNFTEEEKQVVGLSSAVVPPSPSKALKATAQKSLTEMWVDFLLHESGGEMSKPIPRKT